MSTKDKEAGRCCGKTGGEPHWHHWGSIDRYAYWRCSYPGREVIRGFRWCYHHKHKLVHHPDFDKPGAVYHWRDAICGKLTACLLTGLEDRIIDGATFHALPPCSACPICAAQFNEA